MNRNWIEEEFLKKNIITIFGDIDSKMLEYVKKAIAQFYLKGSPEITMLISSCGGDGYIALVICDFLNSYPGVKTAIVIEKAFSAAATILQACDKRFATVNSNILIHNGKVTVDIDVLRDKAKLKEKMKDIEKDAKKKYDLIAKKLSKTSEEIKTQCAKNEMMTAKEAIVFGLIDDIWDKPLPK